MNAEEVERAAKAEDEKVSELLDIDGDGWDLESIGIVDEDREDTNEAKHSGVDYVKIADASHLDPPKQNPSDTPESGCENISVTDFG